MTLLLHLDNIRMSEKSSDRESVGESPLRQIGHSKTINTPYLGDDDGGKIKIDGSVHDSNSEEKLPSPASQPTSSCQALKHAVSALTCIDDFMLEELGGGFFANVYKATHRVTGKEMVMKINKDYANRFGALREIQLMNRLSHPNILRFLGVCVHEGQLHALAEYISGGTLEELLANKNEELPWILRIKLALDIFEGVHYLHSQGVFHRDLTSKNILIKKGENRNYLAVVADFGLATQIPDSRATEPLPPVGCPWWMAPEMINGKFYDERADLFSFGIILLEVTARIEADPETMPRTKNFGVDYVKVCDLVDYCPLDFLQLAFKCCQILPERRPSSSVIKITLENIYKNLNLQNDTVTSSEKLRKRSKSEDNIIQISDSFTDILEEETYMTPQIVAQAMTRDDPHYCPATANPFADISKFKDGRKLLEVPQRKCSGNNCSLGKCVDLLTLSQICECWVEKQESQSLPGSPVMLRKAAERLHLASLLGSEAVRPEGQHDAMLLNVSSDNQTDTETLVVVERKTQFSSSRTRSLGSLDFWNPRYGPGAVGRGGGTKCQFYPNQSQTEYSDKSRTGITNSFCEGELVSELHSCLENQVDEEVFHSACDASINCYVTSDSNNNNCCMTSDSNINCGVTSDFCHGVSSEVEVVGCCVSQEKCDNRPCVSQEKCDNRPRISNLSSFFRCRDIVEEDTLETILESAVPQNNEPHNNEPQNNEPHNNKPQNNEL